MSRFSLGLRFTFCLGLRLLRGRLWLMKNVQHEFALLDRACTVLRENECFVSLRFEVLTPSDEEFLRQLHG